MKKLTETLKLDYLSYSLGHVISWKGGENFFLAF